MKYVSWILLGLIIFLGFSLRVYKVTQDPPGLYLDEVSIGVNAYDILTTGKDQYGVAHPLEFAAYGEYKMPVYIYLVSAAMYFFGKTEFAIRLPSILFGSLTVGVFFFLCKELLEKEIKKKQTVIWLSLIGSLLLATSTWHLQFSRAGFEATVALFFYTLVLVLGWYYWTKKNIVYYVFFCLSLLIVFYTYDGYRLLVPLTVLASWWIIWKEKRKKNEIIIISFVLLLLSLPLILFSFTQGGLVRFSETSAFSEYHFANIWQQFFADGVTYIKNYLSFFSITFLFTVGDEINRHEVQGFGLFYIWQLPYVVLGLLALFQQTQKMTRYLILFLLLSSPIAAAFTLPSPHALRDLQAILPFTFLTVLGLYTIMRKFHKQPLVRSGIFLLTILFALIQFGYYIDYYYVHYPADALYDWGGACKEVAQKLQTQQRENTLIYIDDRLMCTRDYFSFYTPTLQIQFIHFHSISALPKNKNIVLVKPKNQQNPPGKIIDTVYVPNLNHDIFAEFWKL